MIRYTLALVAALLGVDGSSAQVAPRPEPVIKQDQAGSRVRPFEVGPTAIPLNLPYEQLSPIDRAIFNRNYEDIAPGDEPPFPLGGLQTLLDPVRQAQAKLQVDGELFIVATVDASGTPRQIKAYSSPSPDMTQFVAKLMMITKFKPAVCKGQPCSMDFPLRMGFKVTP